MCNGDADGEEFPQVTTSHHQVNDGKRGKPDDIVIHCTRESEALSHSHNCEERSNFFKKNLQPKEQGSANAAQHHEKTVRRAENTNN